MYNLPTCSELIDPTGTWNVVVFEKDVVSPDSGARWEFKDNQIFHDRDIWHGHWTYIPGFNNKIRTYSTFSGKEYSTDEIVFLTSDRFIAVHGNKIIRLGKRL